MDSDMKVNSSLTTKATLYLATCSLMTACGSLVSLDDDIPAPPVPREARQLRIPADLATNKPERSPITAAIATTQRAAVAAESPATMPPAVVTPPPIVATTPAATEVAAKSPDMLFAPYIPSIKEGVVPNTWQKNPVYDFPWIPGAEPTRVNEETVVGAGEQMLGRLYAVKSYTKPVAEIKTVEIKPEPMAKEEIPDKKSKRSKNSKAISLDNEVKKPTVDTEKNKSSVESAIDCDGVTCLDAARDALVADAGTKGWQMLLNRRVSMHQSFQFSRSGRVIWIELNSNGKKDLSIEYSLMPKQNVARKN